MTIPNTFTNGTTADADEVNSNFNWSASLHIHHYVSSTDYISMAIHSATTWSAANDSGTILITSDSGVTWAAHAGSAALDTSAMIRACEADGTHGFGLELTAAGETAFTDDSGANWDATTASPMTTTNYDFCFTTAAIIVVAGDDAGNTKHIVYSTDDGATWTDPTTAPDTACFAVDMFDATEGYAIDSAGKIWKTTGGTTLDVWTDTGHTVSAPGSSVAMKCISATKVIISHTDHGVFLYDNGVGNATQVQYSVECAWGRGIVYSNSNIYVLRHNNDSFVPYVLMVSTDDGVSWSHRRLEWGHASSAITYKHGLYVTADDKLIYPYYRDIVQMDLS
jgi:photosystem II stability/assembly factor-like uncharacterized protein